jgi:Protein of unknown function (DUF1499)
MLKIVILLVLIIVSVDLWVRLAPTSAARWNVDPASAPDPGAAGYSTSIVLPAPPSRVLAELDKIALATPRTRLFAGSAKAGRLTYVTRSRIWGFPDYTTVSVQVSEAGSRLTLLGRLRFGVGDKGVNRARVKSWVQQLQRVIQ